MKVPFAVLIDYCKPSDGDTMNEEVIFQDIEEKSKNEDKKGVSEATIRNYYRGKKYDTDYKKKTGKPHRIQAPKEKTFQKIFKVLWKYYFDMHPYDYKEKAIRFIDYLALTHNLFLIDENEWLEKIRTEKVPNSEDEFSNYHINSYFYFFVLKYVTLWDDESYRKHDPRSLRTQSTNGIRLISTDTNQCYMKQTLSCLESGESFSIDNVNKNQCDFSFFKKNPLIILLGPGGQGKSLFLNTLVEMHRNNPAVFDDVLYIPLISLTYYFQMTPKVVNEDWIRNYIAEMFPAADIDNNDNSYLILLDGFNEFRATNNGKIAEKITKNFKLLISEITKTNNNRISIVVSTRELESMNPVMDSLTEFKRFSISGTDSKTYEEVKDKCHECGLQFENTELASLTWTPLYARMVIKLYNEKLLKGSIKDKYSLMKMVYHERANQRLGIENEKAAYDKSYYFVLYYVVLPYFAYRVSVSQNGNNFTFGVRELEEFLYALTKDILHRTLFSFLINDPNYPDYQLFDKTLPDFDATIIQRFLENEELIIVKNFNGMYKFEHEEWKDFLVSYYLNTIIEYLHQNYNKSSDKEIMSVQMDFNVSSNVAHMVLQSLDLCSDYKNDNGKKLKEYFQISDDDIKKHLFGSVFFLHIAFDLNEYCQLSLPRGKVNENQILHDVFKPLYLGLNEYKCDKRILKVKNDPNNDIGNYNRKRLSGYLNDILSKVTEYCRITGRYDHLYDFVKFSESLDKNSCIMQNQKAKMFLSCSEVMLYEIQLDENSTIKFPKDNDEITSSTPQNELFSKGKELLEGLAHRGFHLSGNTLGLMISTPAPILIEKLSDVELDYCKALRCYLEIMYGAETFVRRDVSYTVKQALRLLLLGYVYVSDESTYDPDYPCDDPDDPEDRSCALKEKLILKVCRPLFTPNINANTVRLVNNMIEKVEGQESPGLNYLRGLACYYRGEKSKARLLFESPTIKDTNRTIYNLQLQYHYGVDNLDEAILNDYEQRAASILDCGKGHYDKTHPVYYYLEEKNMHLSLMDESQREKKRLWFDKFEQEHHIDDVVKTVYDFITK